MNKAYEPGKVSAVGTVLNVGSTLVLAFITHLHFKESSSLGDSIGDEDDQDFQNSQGRPNAASYDSMGTAYSSTSYGQLSGTQTYHNPQAYSSNSSGANFEYGQRGQEHWYQQQQSQQYPQSQHAQQW